MKLKALQERTTVKLYRNALSRSKKFELNTLDLRECKSGRKNNTDNVWKTFSTKDGCTAVTKGFVKAQNKKSQWRSRIRNTLPCRDQDSNLGCLGHNEKY